MDSAKSYPLFWISVVLSILLFVSAINITVDPFGYFGTNKIGFFFSSERQFKSNLVQSNKFDAVVFGDSRIAYTDPKYINIDNYRFANAGIGSVTFTEIFDLLKKTNFDSVKLIVLGIRYTDLKSCDELYINEHSSLWEPIRHAATWSQFLYSVRAIRKAYAGALPEYHEDGTRYSEEKFLTDATLNGQKTDRYLSKIEDMKVNWGNDLEPSTDCLDMLAEMKNIAVKNNAEFVVIFLPYNLDAIENADWGKWVEANSRDFERIRQVVPSFVDFSHSWFSNPDFYWLHDPVHFYPVVGARMIEAGVLISRLRGGNS